jgi:hypothetical protein
MDNRHDGDGGAIAGTLCLMSEFGLWKYEILAVQRGLKFVCRMLIFEASIFENV